MRWGNLLFRLPPGTQLLGTAERMNERRCGGEGRRMHSHITQPLGSFLYELFDYKFVFTPQL